MPSGEDGSKLNAGAPYPWQLWNQKHPPQFVTWQDVLLALTASNHLDRADLLARSLLALRRDFRRPLLTWFKNLFLALKPTLAERLALQAELTELLAQPQPLVVNFALDQLRDLWPVPGFDATPALRYADGLLTRPDLKTGLRALLGAFGKLLKTQPALAPDVARLAAAALAHPDGAVQERAAQLLAGLLPGAKQPLLSAAETAEISGSIALYADGLGAAARNLLGPYAAAPEMPGPGEPAESPAYAPQKAFVPELSAATAVAPVQDWHELLFLTGQVLRHDDPLALERWLDGLLRLQGQFPAGYAEQLRPYVKQVFTLPNQKIDDLDQALAGEIRIDGHDGLAIGLLLSWATRFAAPRVAQVRLESNHYQGHPLTKINQARLLEVERRLRERNALPLLSTPTHAPHWVAPTALVEKLLAYQAAGHSSDPADLAVALARCAHADPVGAAAALARLPQLRSDALRELLTWFLGPAGQPLPDWPAAAPKSRLQRAGEQVKQLLSPPKPADAPAAALPSLWAVAARTKDPAGHFPTLPARLGHDYPGVAAPLDPKLTARTRENRHPKPGQPGQPGQPEAGRQWTELHLIAAPAGSTPPAPLLLYSPAPPAAAGADRWTYHATLTPAYPFLAALVPAYPAALHADVVATAAWADNLEATERDLVAQALRSLLGAGPTFATAASLLLASGLVHSTPLCRSLGLEVLLQAASQRRLVPAELGAVLGQQLATGYAPVARLAGQLAQARGISPRTDDALRQLLDALLPALPAAPPCNTRQLLDLYADLRGRGPAAPVPPAVLARLREWSAVAALKKVVRELLPQSH